LATSAPVRSTRNRPQQRGDVVGVREQHDDDETHLPRQLLLGMRDLGYIEGRHFTLEGRN
jgi:hypothetical protein